MDCVAEPTSVVKWASKCESENTVLCFGVPLVAFAFRMKIMFADCLVENIDHMIYSRLNKVSKFRVSNVKIRKS